MNRYKVSCPDCQSSEVTRQGAVNRKENIFRFHCKNCNRWFQDRSNETKIISTEDKEKDIQLQALVKKLRRGPITIEELSDFLEILPRQVRELLEDVKEERYNLIEEQDTLEISKHQESGSEHRLNPKMWQGDVIRFGFTADNHLCSKFERLDVLNLLYDVFEGEGIEVVLNGGNWIDGEHNFNKFEIHTKGMTNQIEYFINNYPYREGIITKFVAGDDHEGWYAKREGIVIGEYAQMKREQAGMNDLEYLGYLEADIKLDDDGESWMRVMHGGGGSAYATSYTPQKIVESYQGGEKPRVLFLGHYHKLDYCYPREVHVIQMGCTEDQTIFMRKKKLQAHVGGGICELHRASDGTINRCKVEFITAFDKKFYLGDDKYWLK